MGYSRRSLIQAALAGIGFTLGRAQRVLAAPTSRKLALLVGINQYPNATKTPSLSGCVTDVWLQRELLCGRFGFEPADVLTLTDAQATRDQIAQAFREHLHQQARPGDVVVVHFSGYGSRDGQPALLPHDGLQTPTWITEAEWLEWLRQLPTDQVMTVLDTGYDYPGSFACGNVRVRACPPIVSLDESRQFPNAPKPPGVLIRAARPGTVATEALWPGFSAGTLTYALTQTLWGSTSGSVLVDVAAQIAQTVGSQQTPEVVGSPQRLPVAPRAAGRVVDVNDSDVACVLAGVPPWLLAHLAPESQLVTVQGTPLTVRARQGLWVKATAQGPVQVGEWVQERVRVIPSHIQLTVALDTNLERIERVDATSALDNLGYVRTVKAREQSADCLFGRVTPTTYGLFSPGHDLFPGTEGAADETVKAAIKRLTPHFHTLLAAKFLALTDNPAHPFATTVHLRRDNTLLLSQTSVPAATPPANNGILSLPTVPAGSSLTCQITHRAAQPLVVLPLTIHPSQFIQTYPVQTLLPDTPTTLTVNAPSHPGLAELRLLLSPVACPAPLPPEPLSLAQAVLQHLHSVSNPSNPSKDTYSLDTSTWAGLTFIYRVG
ncbi:MAG: caspase family protein [Gloeomargarita sp. SKYG116]|nr:caspase family protein [Gloeomargarita sp. SKYG116]MDW8401188.1 caspase family protein [Gloeomargarita sp. SKYGB_i_bin116]